MIGLLVDLGWKSALVAGAALLAHALLRRRAAAERVAMLRAALAALLLLPVLALAMPDLEIVAFPALEQAPAETAAEMAAVEIDASAPAAAQQTADWIALSYTAGAAAMLAHLVLGWSTLRRWSRRAAPMRDPRWIQAVARVAAQMGLRRQVQLRMSQHVAAPISWGVAPAWVLIDPGTAARSERAEAVVVHELVHVRRLDWPMLLVSRFAVALFWFNPLVWLLARALAREVELAADEEAIRHVARVDYAQALLSLAGSASHRTACGMAASHSALGRRIHSILDARPARPASRLACAAMLACTPLVAPLAAAQLVRAPAPLVTPPAPAEPAPAPVVQTAAPVRAAASPAPARPRSYPRRAASKRITVRRDADPTPSAVPLPGAQRHAGHAPRPEDPPGPPKPKVTVAVAVERVSERRFAVTEIQRRRVEAHHVRTVERQRITQKRNQALALTGAARQLRLKAQRLEREAARPRATKEARETNPVVASSLRREAERLDAMARRLRGSPDT